MLLVILDWVDFAFSIGSAGSKSSYAGGDYVDCILFFAPSYCYFIALSNLEKTSCCMFWVEANLEIISFSNYSINWI